MNKSVATMYVPPFAHTLRGAILAWLIACLFLMMLSAAFGAGGPTNVVPTADQAGIQAPAISSQPADVLRMFLPVLVPLLVGLLKRLFERLPTWTLPILAPAIGAGIDVLMTRSLGANTGIAALYGFAGVGVREAWNQTTRRVDIARAGVGVAIACGLVLSAGCKTTHFTVERYDPASGKKIVRFHAADTRTLMTSKANIQMPVDTNGIPTSINVDVASDPNAAALKAMMDGAAGVTGAAVNAAVKAATKPVVP